MSGAIDEFWQIGAGFIEIDLIDLGAGHAEAALFSILFANWTVCPYLDCTLVNPVYVELRMHLFLMLLQDSDTSRQAMQMLGAMMAIIPILILIGLAIVIIPFWFICKKAGFSPWLALLNFVPLGNIVLLYVLAFADWKVVPLPPAVWPPQAPPPPYPPYPPQR